MLGEEIQEDARTQDDENEYNLFDQQATDSDDREIYVEELNISNFDDEVVEEEYKEEE